MTTKIFAEIQADGYKHRFNNDLHYPDDIKRWRSEQKHFDIVDIIENYPDDMTLMPLDDIPLNTPYILMIDPYTDWIYDIRDEDDTIVGLGTPYKFVKELPGMHDGSEFKIPDRIKTDSGKGLVTWIIWWTIEAPVHTFFDIQMILQQLNCSAYPHKVIFATGAGAPVNTQSNHAKHTVNTYGINVIEINKVKRTFLDSKMHKGTAIPRGAENDYEFFMDFKMQQIERRDELPYKGLCYNGNLRYHRLLTLAHLKQHGHLQDTLFSLLTPLWGYRMHSDEFKGIWNNNEEYHKLHRIMETEFVDKTFTIPDEYNTFSLELSSRNMHGHYALYNHAFRSSFQVVSETLPGGTFETDNNYASFLTEKSYKPFLLMQPFIQYGNAHNMAMLREQGFMLCEKYIDHSYDTYTDPHTRWRLYTQQLDRLYNMTRKELANMLYDVRNELLHNIEIYPSVVGYSYRELYQLIEKHAC